MARRPPTVSISSGSGLGTAFADRIDTVLLDLDLRAGRRALHGRDAQVVEIDVRRERLPNGTTLRGRCGGFLSAHCVELRDDLVVLWIHLEQPAVPSDGYVGLAMLPSNVAQVAQRDQVFGIEIERGLERLTRFLEAAAIVERLAEHDMTADVPRLLRNLAPADLNGAVVVARLSKLVCESREDPARILGVLTKKVCDQGGVGHAMPSEELPRARGGKTRQDIPL